MFDFPDLPEQAFRPEFGEGRFGRGMTFEGGGKNKAPPPDPRMGEAAVRMMELNEAQFADYQDNERPWLRGLSDEVMGLGRESSRLARDQFGFSRNVANRQLGQADQQMAMAKSQVDRANAMGDYQLDNMRWHDQRYRNVAVPFEDRLLQDVNRFDTQAYRDEQVNAAKADVGASFGRMGLQASRNAGRMGITRAIRATNDVGMEQAKAEAAAAYKTEQAARQVGLSSKMQMYGGMRGLAGLGATSAQLATGAAGAGTSAIGVGMGGLNAGMGAMGIGNSALGAMNAGGSSMMGAAGGYLQGNNNALAGYNSGMGAGISGLGQYSSLGIQSAQANAQNDPFNTMLGAAAGIGTSWAMGKV